MVDIPTTSRKIVKHAVPIEPIEHKQVEFLTHGSFCAESQVVISTLTADHNEPP